MPDEPSLGELGRLIQAMRTDFRESLGQVNQRLDKLVSADVYAVERNAMAKDIEDVAKDVEELKRLRSADAERVTQTRRYVLASVVIPVLGLLLPVLLFMLGER